MRTYLGKTEHNHDTYSEQIHLPISVVLWLPARAPLLWVFCVGVKDASFEGYLKVPGLGCLSAEECLETLLAHGAAMERKATLEVMGHTIGNFGWTCHDNMKN